MSFYVVEIVGDFFHQIQQVILENSLDAHRILEVSSYHLANNGAFDKILGTLRGFLMFSFRIQRERQGNWERLAIFHKAYDT